MPELTTDQANRGRKLALVGRRLLELRAKLERTPAACRGPIEEEIRKLELSFTPLKSRAGAQIPRS
jgi:hypothetical protein